ncbi:MULTISPECIES: hypothetical protein [Pseudomonas]|uniref:Uncharacterized protein n=1 Tax=Pseudomonas sp. W17 TaxID=3144407 RepID=A0AAU7X2D3_9PSED|nr:hypothetical protein [Pseudomonas protegens]MCD9572189.1 hypothetical protein [Pseudomonas protegens]
MEIEMVADSLLVACGAFGFSAFCFVSGYIAGGSKREESATFPLTHVSFEGHLSDEDRLMFLASAVKAIEEGSLRKSKQFADDATCDQR